MDEIRKELLKNVISATKPDFYEDKDCPKCGDYMEKDKKTGIIKCVYCEYELK